MPSDDVFRRRHLPHWDVEGKPYFITACLDGSISAAGLKRIQQYRRELDGRPRPEHLPEDEWKRHKHKLVFALVDELLDQQCPVNHLADERQAEIVQNAFLHFASERYTLLAFVVMPSHHHWLFLPDENWAKEVVEQASGKKLRTPREIISQSIQSYTATMCNRLRGASGSYWQLETFDHWVRDEAELPGCESGGLALVLGTSTRRRRHAARRPDTQTRGIGILPVMFELEKTAVL